METSYPSDDNIPVRVSDSAAARIRDILADEPAGTCFRLAVSGGGCSGFQYRFELTSERHDDDLAISKNGVDVLVDAVSLNYLQGAVLDYSDELIGASFRVDNPNATASCGCGTSFSI